MASNDWLSKNFPTLVKLVALFKGNKGQRRQPRRRSQRGAPVAQQEAPSTNVTLEPTAPDLQEAVSEPLSDIEELIEAAEFPPVDLPEIVDGPVTIDDSPIVEETVASTPLASEPRDTPTYAPAQTVEDEPPVQPVPMPAPKELEDFQVADFARPKPERIGVAQLSEIALEFEPTEAMPTS